MSPSTPTTSTAKSARSNPPALKSSRSASCPTGAESASSKDRRACAWSFWSGSETRWSAGVREYWSAGFRKPITPTLRYPMTASSLLPQHLLQRPVLPERLGPADVLLKVGSSADQVADHVVDALVRDIRRRLEETRVGRDGFSGQHGVFLAHPLAERLLRKARVFLDQMDAGHVGAQKI